MSKQKRHTAGNLLFGFQVVCAFIFGGSQARRMFISTQGVSFGFFACHGIFAALNLWLSLNALQNATDETRHGKKQSALMYSLWTVILLVHMSIAYFQMPQIWKTTDTVASIVVAVGILVTIVIAKIKGLPILDPYIKAGLAVFFKCVPQIALAATIYQYGKGGLSGLWIFMGHVTICTRIVHLWLSNRNKWTRETKGLLVSETGNELSWLVATVAFLIF